LVAAAKLSKEEKLTEVASLEGHIRWEKLKDTLESLIDHVPGCGEILLYRNQYGGHSR